ncbi:MAG: hypothetical protein D6714_17380 [Bacteroidetes bacterium]|nr:MAG: hypothetical protein D6714_17380 [Bacteroidota bacterium]
MEKNVSPLRAGGEGLRMPAFFAFSCVGFVGKKVSLLTELENVFEWFSTKMPPLRGWSRFFIQPRPAPAKGGKSGACARLSKRTEPFIFTQKKQIEHVFQPTFSKVGHVVKKASKSRQIKLISSETKEIVRVKF